jgi:aryl-alcohol dehydrogenase-like predicted oxidoreductase
VKKITRRSFVEKSMLGVAALASGAVTKASAGTAVDRVPLGNTGIEASRIAMGTGFRGSARSSNQVRLGRENFIKLMRHGFDNGLNFFDMADLYGSHGYVKDVLKEVPREDVVLLSKIWFADGAGMEPTDRALPSVDRFRKELGVDKIDICLIHCVTNSNWPTELERIRDELSELKEKKVIRATGCSCHDFGALQVAAKDPWVDVIFARINNRSKSMDHSDPNAVAAVLREARSNGKAVVGMKIYGAGQLAEPEQRKESLRYVWGNDLVDAMTIGFEKTTQVDDSIQGLNQVLKA